MQTHALEGGFTDAPIDAARAFRGLMTAMARPGTICDVSGATPPAVSVMAGAGSIPNAVPMGSTGLCWKSAEPDPEFHIGE